MAEWTVTDDGTVAECPDDGTWLLVCDDGIEIEDGDYFAPFPFDVLARLMASNPAGREAMARELGSRPDVEGVTIVETMQSGSMWIDWTASEQWANGEIDDSDDEDDESESERIASNQRAVRYVRCAPAPTGGETTEPREE